MKRRIVETMVMAAALVAFAGGSAFAGTNDGAIAKLEAAKGSYLASVRLEALQAKSAVPAKIATGPASQWLSRVNASDVNMATNRYEKRTHETVTLAGKTYYVGGASYAMNMKNNPSTRFANDPLTNNRVDKADALIYADASGRVFYFESEKTHGDFIGLASPETVYGYSEPR
ncbi:MAG: hypothetical protein ACE5GY_08645 [Thermodesulfobacteriota bacterium]